MYYLYTADPDDDHIYPPDGEVSEAEALCGHEARFDTFGRTADDYEQLSEWHPNLKAAIMDGNLCEDCRDALRERHRFPEG